MHLCRKRRESHRPRRCVSCCRRCGDFSLSVIQRRGSGILDLSQDLVDEHSLQSGLTTVSVRGGKIDCPNATGPNQVVIPEGGVFELIASGHETEEEPNRTRCYVQGTGVTTRNSGGDVRSTSRVGKTAFGELNRRPKMGAALSARSTLSQLQALIRLADNGVLNIQLNSRLQGREALGVMVDGTDA